MKRITLYQHRDCDRCRKIARVHKALDWLDRVRISTDAPATGPLQPGEIAVQDVRTGEAVLGVGAVRRVFRQIPLYAPLRLLLAIPPIARKVDREVRGWPDGRSARPGEPSRTEAAGRA
jgi:hypothetical protein